MSKQEDDDLESLGGGGSVTSIHRLDERLKWVVRTVREIDTKVDSLQEKVTKLVVYISLGAFLGSAIVSVIVGVLIKIITK